MNEKKEYVKATSDVFIKYMFGMDTKQSNLDKSTCLCSYYITTLLSILPNSYQAKHPRSCKATAKVSTLTSTWGFRVSHNHKSYSEKPVQLQRVYRRQGIDT